MFNMINRVIVELQTRKDVVTSGDKAQGLVEYGLILSLVSIACVVALGALAGPADGSVPASINGVLKTVKDAL